MRRLCIFALLVQAALLLVVTVLVGAAAAAPASLWQTMDIAGAGWFRSLSFVDASTGWASGYTGHVAVTIDGGASWTLKREVAGDYLTDVSALSSDVAWVTGYREEAGQTRSFVLHTADGGATWQEYDFPLQSYRYSGDLTFVDGSRGFVAVGGALYATTDAGATWQATPLAGFVESFCFLSAEDGWALSSSIEPGTSARTIWKTVDAGKTWTEQPTPPASYGRVWRLTFVNSLDGYAATDYGYLFTTDDGGSTWTQTAPVPGGMTTFCAVDSDRAWLACSGDLYGTDDGGLTWSPRALPGPPTYASDLAVVGDRAWIGGSVNYRTDKSGYSDMRPPLTTSDAPRYSNQPLTVHLEAHDEGSGVVATWYRVGEGDWQQGNTVFLDTPASPNASYDLYCSSQDAYGNFEPTKIITVRFDLSGPVVTFGTVLEGQLDHWTNRDCTFQVSAMDDWWGVGADHLDIRQDGGDWTWEPPGFATVVRALSSHANDGVHQVEGRGVDALGNVGASEAHTVGIDTRAPRASAPKVATARSKGTGALVFKVADTRPCSGVCAILVTVKTLSGRTIGVIAPEVWFKANRLTTLKFECPLRAGKYLFTVKAVDGVGNKTSKVARNFLVVRSARSAGRTLPSGLLPLEPPAAGRSWAAMGTPPAR